VASTGGNGSDGEADAAQAGEMAMRIGQTRAGAVIATPVTMAVSNVIIPIPSAAANRFDGSCGGRGGADGDDT
jgi:hypothetical protein